MTRVQDIEISIDGLTLRGALHSPAGPGETCVVISHGFAGYGDSPKWNFMAGGLAGAGFHAVRFSHRGCGASGGDFADTTLTTRVRELRAAMDAAVHLTGARRLALFGSSFGGVTAILCAGDPRVRAVLVMGTPADFDFFSRMFRDGDSARDAFLQVDGMRVKSGILIDVMNYDIMDAASQAPALCVFHGQNDELLPVSHAERIFNAACEPKELHGLPGADHPFSNEKDQKLILDAAVRWFSTHCVG